MLRPNYAMDEPPTCISVGGYDYSANTDYRVWLQILCLMRDISAKAPERNAAIIEEIQTLAFGGILADEDPEEVLRAISEFSKGYPTAPMHGTAKEEPTFSFEYDLNEIIIAIRNQSGKDISWRCKHFHWWEFLLEFHTLCGDHYILNLMEARGYEGNDKDLLKRKYECALPPEYTADELAEWEEFSAQFD